MNYTEEPDALVSWEFDHCDNFDDEVSIQTSNSDLNNQLASWQQRNDDSKNLFESDSSSESEDGIFTSAYHVAFANNEDPGEITFTKCEVMSIK